MLLTTHVAGSGEARISGVGCQSQSSRASAGGVELHAWGCGGKAEALLAEYLEHGEGMSRWAPGPFACAAIDRRRGAVSLMRDRFGFAPLFYRVDGERLCCSNSLAEAAAQTPRPGIDPAGLGRYYLFGFVVPPSTLFQGVSQVPGGSCVTFHRGSASVSNRDPFPAGHRTRAGSAELAEDVAAAVRESVRDAKAPAMALSGGLDSAVVFSSLPPGAAPCFILRSRDHPASIRAAESICNAAGQTLHEIDFGPEEFRLLPEFVEALAEPVCALPLFYLFLLLRGISGKADVVLLGEGGDELFLGYRHQIGLVERFIRTRLSGRAPELRRSALEERWRRMGPALSGRPHDFERAVECLPPEPRDGGMNEFLDALVCQELTCFPYFYAGARLGARFGMDVRCPLLSRRVIDHAFSLSWEALLAPEVRRGITKLPLRRAFRGRIPPEILDSPKSGFGEEWTGYREMRGLAGELSGTAFARLRECGLPAGEGGGAGGDFFWQRLILGTWLDRAARV